MYEHHLRDMVKLLTKKKVIKAEQEAEAQAALSKYWEDKIALTWCAQDVIDYAKGYKKRVSKKRANEILQRILHRHDCEYGVSWLTISNYL